MYQFFSTKDGVLFNIDLVYFSSPQDNYTFAQPGIQRKVKALEELVSRIDGKLTIQPSGALYIQVSL